MDAKLKKAIKRARYQFKVKYGNRVCPYPGCWRKPTDAHHVLVTRDPDHPLLYCRENMVLVCQYHHVPPANNLNYHCVRWILTKGKRTHEEILAWIEGLPWAVTPDLPEFYWTALYSVECGIAEVEYERVR